MTASIYRRLTTLSNLRSTWETFWALARRQRVAGVDGVTPAIFHRNAERNLELIYRDLRSGYMFSGLRGHPIPKKDGKSYRMICVPNVRDRIVQRLLAKHLIEKADTLGIINEVSFGFIPTIDGRKRGVQAARDRTLELRGAHRWAYKSDISSFFDRIPRATLVNQTIATLRTRSLRSILVAAASCEIDETDGIVARVLKETGIVKGLGVRQGMPLSPVFANIILRDFDREMVERGVNMVRYADDFIVLTDTERECREVDVIARDLLAKKGFELPPLDMEGSKTYVANPDEEIEFLGLAVVPVPGGSYQLLLTERQIEKVKREVNTLKDVKRLVGEGIDITKLIRTIEFRIGGYLAAYKDAQNIQDLRVILEQCRTGILRSIFVAAFGEDGVQSLNPSMRKFFQLDPITQFK